MKRLTERNDVTYMMGGNITSFSKVIAAGASIIKSTIGFIISPIKKSLKVYIIKRIHALLKAI